MPTAPSVIIPNVTPSITLFSPGMAPFQTLSQNYGPSLSALWRHKKHLQEKMRQAEKRLEHHRRQDYLFKFNNFLDELPREPSKPPAPTATPGWSSRPCAKAPGFSQLHGQTGCEAGPGHGLPPPGLTPMDHPEQSPAHRPPVHRRHPPGPGRLSLLPLPGASPHTG